MDAHRSDEEASISASSRKSEHDGLKDFPWSIEIALSGGGHRAAAYALGALLYLVHATLNSRVRNISSVSGASITNAFVASQCDFQAVKIDEFKVIASKLILKMARRGLLSIWTTWFCVAAVIIVAVSASIAFGLIWWTFVSNNSPSLDAWGIFLTFLLVVSLALTSRGWIIDRWMAAVYFPPRRSDMRPWDTVIRLEDIDRATLNFSRIAESSAESSTVATPHLGVISIFIKRIAKLRDFSFAQVWREPGALLHPSVRKLAASGGGRIAKERKWKPGKIDLERLRVAKGHAESTRIMEMDNGVDHVFCATDLSSGRPFFFSSAFGGRQVSTFYGRAEAPFVPLQVAVRASSAFPPAIPAIPYRPQRYHSGLVQFFRKNRRHLHSRSSNDQDGFGRGIEVISSVPTIWLTDGGAYNNFGTDWHVARRVVYQLDLRWISEFHPLSNIGNKQISRVIGLSYYGQIQLIVDAPQPARRTRLADLYVPIWELFRYAFRTMNVMYGSTLEARSGEGYFVAFDRLERYPAKWSPVSLAKQPATYEERHANAQELQREFWDQGALQIFIPYQTRLDLIYSWWKDRKRNTADSKARWNAHPRDRDSAIAALGESLVPNEVEIVRTTFRSLGCRQTLRLVVAGYLNTREAIYGPFDYRPEKIPETHWFEELLTLAR